MHDPYQPSEETNQPRRPDDRTNDTIDPDESLLVAYLDGELDADTALQLETRLGQETGLRQRLRELQQTWDMLDILPPKRPDESFVESTIEMMVTSTQRQRAKWHRWPIRIALGVCAFGLATAIAFQTVRYVQNQPHRQFVRDLQFIENVDAYLAVRDIEFLEQLHEAAIFTEELPETSEAK